MAVRPITTRMTPKLMANSSKILAASKLLHNLTPTDMLEVVAVETTKITNYRKVRNWVKAVFMELNRNCFSPRGHKVNQEVACRKANLPNRITRFQTKTNHQAISKRHNQMII